MLRFAVSLYLVIIRKKPYKIYERFYTNIQSLPISFLYLSIYLNFLYFIFLLCYFVQNLCFFVVLHFFRRDLSCISVKKILFIFLGKYVDEGSPLRLPGP